MHGRQLDSKTLPHIKDDLPKIIQHMQIFPKLYYSVFFLPVQLLQRSHGSSGMHGTFASSARYPHFSAKTPRHAFPTSQVPIVLYQDIVCESYCLFIYLFDIFLKESER